MMLTLDVLIATCNNRLLNVPKMNLGRYPNVRYLIIHQLFDAACDMTLLDACRKKLETREDIEIHRVDEQGTSKSRNRAIAASQADICLLSDDDTVFFDNALPKVLAAFEQHPEDHVICFKMVYGDGQPVRWFYPDTDMYMSRISDYQTATSFWMPEIAFRRSAVLTRRIRFNEWCGLGTRFPLGEEGLFLADCYRRGLTMAFCQEPILICPEQHTGTRDDLEFWFAKGVVLTRLYGASMPLRIAKRMLIGTLRHLPNRWRKFRIFLAGYCYYWIKARKLYFTASPGETT